MANQYKAATGRIHEDPNKPIAHRTFELLLVDPKRSKFDADHATVEDIEGEKGNAVTDRVTLRTQVINDPTRGFSIEERVLQFFAQDPNQSSLLENNSAGVIIERDEDKEVPLFYLNKDDVFELAHGGGFSTALHPGKVKATK